MGSQIIEVATTGNIWLKAPRQLGCFGIVKFTRRYGKTNLYIDDFTDGTIVYQFLDFLEIGQIATVVGHKAGHTRLRTDAVDAGTVLVRGCQRFLYIHRFSSLHSHNRKGSMAAGRRSNIDSIHVGIVNELLGIGIPFRYAVSLSIATRLLLLATHHRHHAGAFYLRERRPAFLFCHLTTSDEAPP